MRKQNHFLTRCTLLVILSGLLSITATLGQSSIKGDVVSTESESMAYANVLLLSVKDSSLIKGVVVADDGNFSLEQVEKGDYIVAVSMMGFETTYTPVIQLDAMVEYELGTITLKRLQNELAEVKVTARKLLYEQYIDRLVVNVEKDIVSAGSNALEVIARIPGVTVNELTASLSVNGNQGVLVIIDGKLSRLPMDALFNFLRTMNAENIQKIELFETPPAEYEAEGKGGLIKIITTKNPELGTNGSYAFNAGYGRRVKYGASVNINHRTNKSNIYGSYSFRNNFSRSIYSFDRLVSQDDQLIFTDTRNLRNAESFSHNIRLGFDLEVSERTTLGGFLTGFIDNSLTEADNRSSFSEDEQLFSQVKNLNREERMLEHGMVNAYIQHQFSSGGQIEFDVDYLTYTNANPSTYDNDFYDGNQELVDQSNMVMERSAPIENLSLKIDYSTSFADKVKFKMGLKGFRSLFDNDILVEDVVDGAFVKNDLFSQDYRLEENIGAAYTSLDFPLGEKTNVMLGLRYEYTDYLLSTHKDSEFLDLEYDNLFPSLFIAHNFTERQQLQFSYSRRITRPAFDELAPFVTFIDPNTFFSGNPSLVPGVTDNARLSYRWNNIMLTTYYGITEEAIYKYQPVVDPSSNTQIYTTLNIDEEHQAGIRLSLPVSLTKWWEVQNVIDWGWNRLLIKDGEQESTQEIKAYAASSTHRFALPDGWSFDLTGVYQSEAFYGLLRVQPKGALNIGIRKILPNDNGTISLNATDLLRTNVWRSSTQVPELNLNNTSAFDVETRIIRLAYSATLGSNKVKAARNRTTSSADQRRRF